MPTRRRLDVALHRRGLAPSRQQARELIDAGRVLVCGAPAAKASRQVGDDEPLQILGPPPRYVSRGGRKLAPALERFGVDVAGARVLDAGASTGGFTDAVLQAGATSVVAVDVGRHQLHERLRADARVDSREQTDIRSVGPESLGGPVDVVVADLSFISLRAVIDVLVRALRPGGELVVLVKPQFEAGRAEAARGRGVISDPEVWRRVLLEDIVAIEEAGAAIMDAMASPLRGAEGNVEFLVHARRPAEHNRAADPSVAAPVMLDAGGPDRDPDGGRSARHAALVASVVDSVGGAGGVGGADPKMSPVSPSPMSPRPMSPSPVSQLTAESR